MLDLRPYQHEALQSIRKAYKDGKRRVIVSLPTGTGKTVVFAQTGNLTADECRFGWIWNRKGGSVGGEKVAFEPEELGRDS
jgi:hypothetical protein